MTLGSAVVVPEQGFTPLASLLCSVAPVKRYEAQQRVARLGREELIDRFRVAFAGGKRVTAFLMAEALVVRDIPPCFWHELLVLDGVSINQRFDLLLADLMWLRRWYPNHAKVVRYQRGKALLTGSDMIFHREAEFAFYQGRRPAWKLVGSLSMNERQQWDSAFLRSDPIKKRAAMIDAVSERVFKLLEDDVHRVRRTAAFGEAEARATLLRRHSLWRCSRMVRDGGPTEIAARFEQFTGSPITRQLAAKQLEKVRVVLDKIEMTL